jgi:hypothetical protein
VVLADRFTDLLTAWSTFGGAVGSILAVVVAYLLLRREIRSRFEEKRDAEAAAARLVTAEICGGEPDASGKVGLFSVVVRNFGDAPVLDLELNARLTTGETASMLTRSLDPRSEWIARWQLATAISEMPDHFYDVHFTTEIIFTDSRGLRWTRRNRDQPQRWVERPWIPRRFRVKWWLTYRRQELGGLLRRAVAWTSSSLKALRRRRGTEPGGNNPTPPAS